MATYFQLPTGKTLKINNILDFSDDDFQKAMAFDQGEFINNPFMSKVKEDNMNNDSIDGTEECDIDDILREYILPDIENIEDLDIEDDI